MKLGEILVSQRMITADQLQAALQAQSVFSEKLGTTLVESGALSVEQLTEALSLQFGVPAAQDAHFQRADPQLRTRLKAAQAARLKAIPLFATSARRIAVAMVDPGNPEILQELSFILNATIEPLVTPDMVLTRMLERLYAVPRRRNTTLNLPAVRGGPRPSSEIRIRTTSFADDVGDCIPAIIEDEPLSARRRSALVAPVDELPPLTPVPLTAPMTPAPPSEVDGRARHRGAALAETLDSLLPLTPAQAIDPEIPGAPPPLTPVPPAKRRPPPTPPPLHAPHTPPAPAGLRPPPTPPPLPALAHRAVPPPVPGALKPLTPVPPSQAAFAPLVPEPTPPPTRIPTPLFTPVVSSDEVVLRILSAPTRMEAAEALLTFMRSSFRAGAMFTVSGVFALGRFGFGPHGMSPGVESVSFSLSLPSCFRQAYHQRATFRGAPPAEGAAVHQRLWNALADEVPAQVLVAPVMVGANISLLLYAHGRTLDAHAAGRMENVCVALGSALERLVE